MRVDGPAILAEAFLFDMDGTLTEPLLDFPRIKAEMGIGNRPILEALAEMDDSARRRLKKSCIAMKMKPPPARRLMPAAMNCWPNWLGGESPPR